MESHHIMKVVKIYTNIAENIINYTRKKWIIHVLIVEYVYPLVVVKIGVFLLISQRHSVVNV